MIPSITPSPSTRPQAASAQPTHTRAPEDGPTPAAIVGCGTAPYASLAINARGYEGQSQLHVAAEYGNLSRVERLLGLGANLFMEDENGATPRRLAELNHRTDVVERLDLWRAAVVKEFVKTATAGDLPAVQQFSQNVTLSYTERVALLAAAADGGSKDVVSFLLGDSMLGERDLQRIADSIRGNHPQTDPLPEGSREIESLIFGRILYDRINHWDLPDLQTWVQRTPTFDANKAWDGRTSLHMLAQYGEAEDIGKVRFLLELGVDPNVRNSDGYTAEQLAMRKGLNEIAATLGERRA
ncbi:ankyrin repeat domain-containing protein [Stenotrophomonas bentonitica]|uniref:ankyrin repeat domain-containing protein n=1 Tax=Stenotrophomonas bentonitica TaxID=1450134 RepID=UPI00345F1199